MPQTILYVKKMNDSDTIVNLHNVLEENPAIQHFFLKDSQCIFIPTKNKDLTVKVTIANSVFEWFIDVCDSEKNIILSTWVDHYGSSKEELKKEMNREVSGFINSVANKNVRLYKYLGLSGKDLIDFQYEENGRWQIFPQFDTEG